MSDLNQQENSEEKDPKEIVSKWLALIKAHNKEFRAWRKTGDDIVKKYKNEAKSSGDENYERVMFNILWSNVQTLKPAHFARMPKIVVERRIKSSDPISRLAATIAENLGHFNLSQWKDEHETAFNQALEDRLLPGRGLVWNRYVPEFEDVLDEVGNTVVDEEGSPVQQKVREKIIGEYLFWKDFGHTPGRTWADIANGGAAWKRQYLTKEECKERWPDYYKDLDYSCKPLGLEEKNDKGEDIETGKAEIYEIWDSKDRQVIWLSESYEEAPLEIQDDPLHLQKFFPFSRPLYATLSTDSLIPTADYSVYRGLAEDLESITKRISALTEMVRLVGVHSAEISANLSAMFDKEDGELTPINSWQAFSEGGGFKGVLQWMPIKEVVEAISQLHQQREVIIAKIYEITGISDIIRGSTNPNETATAQQIKGQFANLRIAKSQGEVQRFLRDNIAIQIELMVEHYDDQAIADMGGYDTFSEEDKQIFIQALQLLRNDKLRTFKIEIETDSTISVDEAQEKEDRREYLQSVGTYWQQAFQVAQIQPEFKKPMMEGALWAARSFRSGRQLEQVFERAIADMEAAEQAAKNQPPQPPPPDPKMVEAQNKAQLAQQQLQIDQFIAQKEIEIKQFLAQHKQNLDMQKIQMNAAVKQQAIQGDMQIKAQAAQQDMQLKAYELTQGQQLEQAKAIRESSAQTMATQASQQNQMQPLVLNVNLPPT